MPTARSNADALIKVPSLPVCYLPDAWPPWLLPGHSVDPLAGCHKDVGINVCLWILGGLPGEPLHRNLITPSDLTTMHQTLSVADDHCLVIGIIHAFWVVAKHTRPSPLPGDIESALYITSPAGSEVNIPISHHSRTARGNGNGNGNGRGRESSIQVPAPVHSNSPRMYEYNLPSGAGSPRAQPAAQGPRSGEITPTRKTTMAEGPFADPAHTGAGSASAPAYQVLAEWKPEGKSGDA
jgi:uncharacterized membrane protein YqaE (UPF0057 family)